MLLLALFTSPAPPGQLAGITIAGDLYAIDDTTGQASFVGSTGLFANNLTRNRLGEFVAFGLDSDTFTWGLFRVSADATRTEIATFSSLLDVRGLAADLTDSSIYWAIVSAPDVTTIDELYRLSVSGGIGTATFVGATGDPGIQGFDIGPDGAYVWSNNTGLRAIDLATGSTTDVNPAISDVGRLQSIALGSAFGVANSLYSIDLATGAQTLIGPLNGLFGEDLRGVETDFVPIPEPGTLALVAVASSVLLCARARSIRSRSS